MGICKHTGPQVGVLRLGAVVVCEDMAMGSLLWRAN